MSETVWFDVHHKVQMYQVQDDLLLQVVVWDLSWFLFEHPFIRFKDLIDIPSGICQLGFHQGLSCKCSQDGIQGVPTPFELEIVPFLELMTECLRIFCSNCKVINIDSYVFIACSSWLRSHPYIRIILGRFEFQLLENIKESVMPPGSPRTSPCTGL